LPRTQFVDSDKFLKKYLNGPNGSGKPGKGGGEPEKRLTGPDNASEQHQTDRQRLKFLKTL
jgi:hypothetical protein